MTVLDSLRKVMEDVTRRPHPFAGESESFRLFYLVGVTIMALTKDDTVDDREMAYLKNLIQAMGLGESRFVEIVKQAQEGSETTIQSLVQSLTAPDQKYAFAFDLLNIMRIGSANGPEGREKLTLFMDLMKFVPAERNFVAAFAAAAVARDGTLGDKALVEAYENGLQPDVKVFSYFFPELVVAGASFGQHPVLAPTQASAPAPGPSPRPGSDPGLGRFASPGERWFGPGKPD